MAFGITTRRARRGEGSVLRYEEVAFIFRTAFQRTCQPPFFAHTIHILHLQGSQND
jgi:hypothetical protein